MADSITDEKLDTLALSRRRLYSPYPDKEFFNESSISNWIERYEAEDRKKGQFPYDSNTVQTITEFYNGKDILITGGTGFLGKVLIEKILRSLPKGGRIFLLLRGKKNLSPEQRLKAMLNLPLFKLVMTENPKAAERLVAVEGDCVSLGLGLSQADRQTIVDNVSIVFHCAATVRFNLPFSFVILVNTRGTREVVNLCKELKKLDAFVYVSTAYSCATRDRRTPIPEEVLHSSVDWRTVIAAAEKSLRGSKRDRLDLIFEKLQPTYANNYTYSKFLSENLVEEECRGLPAIIVRPSVLVPTYEDPFGGWIDNLYGPLSIWNGISAGLFRVHYGDANLALDYLPVDASVKTLICAAWHRGLGFRMRSDPEKVDVINDCTSGAIKTTFAAQRSVQDTVLDTVSRKYILRYPRLLTTQKYWIFWLITITSHLPLGVLVDTVLKLRGKKPLLVAIYRRIFYAQKYFLFYFCTHEFHFDGKWHATLDARVPKEEQDRFSWKSRFYQTAYAVDTIAGVMKYVFHETPVTRDQSNSRIMHIVDWIHTAILVSLGLWILSWMV